VFRLPRPPRSGNRTPLPRSPDVLQRAEASGTGELRDCPWRWGAGSPKPRGCTSGASRHRALGRASAGRLAGTGTSLSVLPAGKPVRRSERRPGWSASAGAPTSSPILVGEARAPGRRGFLHSPPYGASFFLSAVDRVAAAELDPRFNAGCTDRRGCAIERHSSDARVRHITGSSAGTGVVRLPSPRSPRMQRGSEGLERSGDGERGTR